MNKNDTNDQVCEKDENKNKPNEIGGFYFSSHIKITDPNTQEVLLQQRGDN